MLIDNDDAGRWWYWPMVVLAGGGDGGDGDEIWWFRDINGEKTGSDLRLVIDIAEYATSRGISTLID